MKLKTSNYNFFFDAEDGYILAYNAFSNSFARVDREKFKLIEKILEAPGKFSFDSEEKEKLKKDLVKGYFLIDERLSELEILKMRNRIGRYSKEYIGLSIAPTLACNFHCTYCFEDRKTDTMTKEVEDALIKFVENRLNTAKSLSVSWFGGEPTLEIDIIERLTNEFQRLCRDNNVYFGPMAIITNGYLLTKKIAEKLKKLNIVRAQLTVDGPPDVHDKRRKLNNGKGTFLKIMENIKEVKDILNIHIRVNVDKDNIDRVEELYKFFGEYGFLEKVPFYFGNVQGFINDSCADVSTVCFSTKEYSSTVIDLLKRCREKGISNPRYPAPTHFGFCSADKLNTYVVAPSGCLYKCWSEISFTEEHSVGTVFEENLDPNQINNLTKYLNLDPFTNQECLECKYFPICSGGCPYNALNKEKFQNENCIDFKYNLDEMLRLKYDALKKNKKIK